jgi:hypothetical protein
MTHDFHYYVTFMCARNAGFDIETSKKIALCADGVDGGDTTFAHGAAGKYKQVLYKNRLKMVSYYPLTVHHMTSSVNSDHSTGASILSLPWMAFHFLPSLEVDFKTNPFNIEKIDRVIKGNGDHPRFSPVELHWSRKLESGLICSKDSRFARELINDTAKLAKKFGTGKFLNPHEVGILGIRAHVIADLFAHEGFAGCRSKAVNALNHANTLDEKKMNYSLDSGVTVSALKTMRASRLGHGQAGQRPDEPFLKYRIQRKIDNVTFEKNNYDLFGAAVMTITEVLKGRSENITKDYQNWKAISADYPYKWEDIRDRMNQGRSERIKALKDFFKEKYPKTDLGEHDRRDYWAFDQMDGSLRMGFSLAADAHIKWFHETFFAITGASIDEYMDVSVLWPWSDADDAKAREHNTKLLSGEKIHVGKTSGDINGHQIGIHYMKRHEGADLKPSIIYSKITGIKVYGS